MIVTVKTATAALILEHNKDTKDKVILKIDMKNAFNTLRRDQILTKVKNEVPSIYKMVKQCYGQASNLYFNSDTIIESKEGGLAPFCLHWE